MAQAAGHTNSHTEEDYYRLPEHIRAELIDGQFYYISAPSRVHQEILSFLHVEIANYIRSKGGSCKVYPAPFAVRLFDDNTTVVEPDISVICDPGRLTHRGCSGAPDWIIEITSPSNSSHDYIRKLNLYNDAGVREYWVVNPERQSVYVYHLKETPFETAAYTFRDRVKSGVLDHLWIDFQHMMQLTGI